MQMLVMCAMALVMMLVSALVVMALTSGGLDTTSPSGLRWSQAITSVLTFALPVVVMTSLYYKGEQREFYGLRFGGHEWLVALAGVVAMLLVVPLNELLSEWNDTWDLGAVGDALRAVQDQNEDLVGMLLSADTVGDLVANIVVVALAAAVCEELFFRCGVQNLLERWFRNPHAAVVVTACVFSLIHGEIFSFVPRLVLGILLGYLYVYGRSPLPNMLAHFVNNALVVVLYWLVARGVLDIDPEAPIDFGWPLTAACTVAAVGLMWAACSRRKDNKDQGNVMS